MDTLIAVSALGTIACAVATILATGRWAVAPSGSAGDVAIAVLSGLTLVGFVVFNMAIVLDGLKIV
jgi:hypothetical protein